MTAILLRWRRQKRGAEGGIFPILPEIPRELFA